MAAIQIARLFGASPIVVTRRQEKAELLRSLGAAEVLVSDGNDLSKAVRSLVPEGVDIVVEAVGGDIWAESLASLRPGGTALVCGAHTGLVVPLNLRTVFRNHLTIIGSARAPRWAMAEAIEYVASGAIKVPLDRVYPFEQIHDALKRVEMTENVGKVVVAMEQLEQSTTHR